jgi:hypothetical protein
MLHILSETLAGYYPQLIALYKHLGVSFRRSNFSYSFSFVGAIPPRRAGHSKKDIGRRARLALHPTLIYNGASGRAGISVPSAQKEVYTTLPQSTLGQACARLAFFFTFVLSMTSLSLIFVRLQLLASPWLRGKCAEKQTWAQWTESNTPSGPIARMTGLDVQWRTFIRDVCVPLFSAVCTAPRNDVENHPAEEFLGLCFHSIMKL